MIRAIAVILVCLFGFGETALARQPLDFTLHKLESGRPGKTLLVIGGIQGDEPGGFNAASLLVTDYRILKGSVWVVPNLNFISIIKRKRGVYGDLNRKFASIRSTDPEFDTIEKVKKIILDEKVDIVLNHHDGSGFFRPWYIDKTHNQKRWGQSIIIDRERIEVERFGDLGGIAGQIAMKVNRHLYSDEHSYRVNNTRTHLGNGEMSKTLTYFAVRNAKSAFGVEASKALPTHKRAYYHLRVLESFMSLLGIEYESSFKLSPERVRKAIRNNANLTFYDNRIFLDVGNARRRLSYIPLKKGADIAFTPGSPLITVVSAGKYYRIYHGNRRLTHIHPEYFEYDSSIQGIIMRIDGHEKSVRFGEMVDVICSFLVMPKEGYRVNVIGFRHPGVVNESGVAITRRDIAGRFSVDRTGHIFRIEVYREKKFSGMVLVNFGGKAEEILASR